eukprot:1334414-Amorphochlora_amoeboformis.AAC.1
MALYLDYNLDYSSYPYQTALIHGPIGANLELANIEYVTQFITLQESVSGRPPFTKQHKI